MKEKVIIVLLILAFLAVPQIAFADTGCFNPYNSWNRIENSPRYLVSGTTNNDWSTKSVSGSIVYAATHDGRNPGVALGNTGEIWSATNVVSSCTSSTQDHQLDFSCVPGDSRYVRVNTPGCQLNILCADHEICQDSLIQKNCFTPPGQSGTIYQFTGCFDVCNIAHPNQPCWQGANHQCSPAPQNAPCGSGNICDGSGNCVPQSRLGDLTQAACTTAQGNWFGTNNKQTNDPNGNKCCGNNPWADLGYVINETSNSGAILNRWVCLSDNTYTNYQPIAQNWKWVRVDETNEPFTIHGVNITTTPGKRFDITSNSLNWFSCGLNAAGNALSNPVFVGQSLIDNPSVGTGGGIGSGLNGSSGGGTGGTGGTNPGGIVNGNNFFGDINLSQGSTGMNQGAQLTVFPDPVPSGIQLQISLVGSSFDGTSIAQNSIQLRNSTNSIITTAHPTITFASRGFNINIAGIQALNPGVYDVLIQTTGTNAKSYTFSDIFNADPSTSQGPGGTPQIANAARIMCFQEENHGSFAECCGLNFFNCQNKQPWDVQTVSTEPYPKTLRAGEVLGTIEDYYGGANDPISNYVRRWGFDYNDPNSPSYYVWSVPQPIPSSGHLTNPIRIRDWTSYDNLEFDIAFTNDDNLTLQIFDNSNEDIALGGLQGIGSQSLESITPTFSKPVRQFSIDGNKHFSWHHIIVPLAENGLKRQGIGFIRFYEGRDSIHAAELSQQLQYPWGSWVIYGVDRVFLSRNSENINLARFCATNSSWITDLDTDPIACENTVTTHWTGNKCCGDDQARNNATVAYQIETFNDKNAGCWSGRTVKDDQTVDLTFNSTVGIQIGGITNE